MITSFNPSEEKDKGSLKMQLMKEFIGQIDNPDNIDFEKLRAIFDLLDDELLKEYEGELSFLEPTNLCHDGLKGLNSRRNEIEILALILKTVGNGANRTKILYQANLSYTQLKNYLGFLIDNGFVKHTDGLLKGGNYTATPKANIFLYHWSKILDLLNNETPVLE